MKNVLTFFLLCSISTLSFSQSYVGLDQDNYAGVHGLLLNPANIADSNFRLDVNVFSVSIAAGSDYFGVDIADVFSSISDFNFDEDVETTPENQNHFFVNTDILGPSFMMNINPKHSIGLITRARTFLNFNDIDGVLIERIVDDFDGDDDFDFAVENYAGTIHAWGEIGIAYGTVLLDNDAHQINAGVTLKLLLGVGGTFVTSPELAGQFIASTETLATQGSLNFGVASGFDLDDININSVSTGFGLDLGATYQWRSEDEVIEQDNIANPYKLKIGVAVTDIGSVSYDDSVVTNYDLNATVSTENFEDDIQDFLDQNYDFIDTDTDAKISLPTAMRIFADYKINQRWYVGAQGNLSLTDETDALANNRVNSFVLTPRMETKALSLFAPLSIRQYSGFAFGFGLRWKWITLGSGSVFTNLFSSSSQATDFFVGFKIPFFKNGLNY